MRATVVWSSLNLAYARQHLFPKELEGTSEALRVFSTMLQYNSSATPSQRQLHNVVTSTTGVEDVQPFTLGGYIAGTPTQKPLVGQTLTR